MKLKLHLIIKYDTINVNTIKLGVKMESEKTIGNCSRETDDKQIKDLRTKLQPVINGIEKELHKKLTKLYKKLTKLEEESKKSNTIDMDKCEKIKDNISEKKEQLDNLEKLDYLKNLEKILDDLDGCFEYSKEEDKEKKKEVQLFSTEEMKKAQNDNGRWKEIQERLWQNRQLVKGGGKNTTSTTTITTTRYCPLL